MPLRLKEAEEARTLCVSIEGLECSEAMTNALTQHAGAMTALYRDINARIGTGADEESAYEPFHQKAASYQTWYKSRKKVANSMKQAAAASK